ncbi:MAG: prepilin-type N-terminal cleavage/methylation domain-containing protein [Bacillota bacterium]|nr:prepilin-type N-terminal cleavage/methylation domain-containing protein [Bacillota bacterium]
MKGLTLIEVLVAVAIVGLAIVPLTLQLGQGTAWLGDASTRVLALDLLQRAAEETKATSYASVGPISPPQAYPPGSTSFLLSRELAAVPMNDSDGQPLARQVTLRILRSSDQKVMAECTFLIYRDGGY